MRSYAIAYVAFGVVFAGAGLNKAVSQTGSDCGIWAGVVDQNETLSTRYRISEMHDILCRHTESSDSAAQAHKRLLDASIPIPIADQLIPLHLGVQQNEDDRHFHSFREGLCTLDSSREVLDTRVLSAVRDFGPNALAAAKACYENTSQGLHATIIPEEETFAVRVWFLSTGDKETVSKPVSVVPAEAVKVPDESVKVNGKCNPSDLFKGRIILGDHSVSCDWDRNHGASIDINTDGNKAAHLHLRADPIPPPQKPGDILQSTTFDIHDTDEKQEDCTDNMNQPTDDRVNFVSGPVKCSWWKFAIYPQSKNGRSEISVKVDVDTGIRFAPGPIPAGSNDCNADPLKINDVRGGAVVVRCGDQLEHDYHQDDVKSQPGYRSFSFQVPDSCASNGQMTKIEVLANPRGCSEMHLKSGSVTITETQK